jgi:hypothetical protein
MKMWKGVSWIEIESLHSKSRKRNDVAPPPLFNWSLLEPREGTTATPFKLGDLYKSNAKWNPLVHEQCFQSVPFFFCLRSGCEKPR